MAQGGPRFVQIERAGLLCAQVLTRIFLGLANSPTQAFLCDLLRLPRVVQQLVQTPVERPFDFLHVLKS